MVVREAVEVVHMVEGAVQEGEDHTEGKAGEMDLPSMVVADQEAQEEAQALWMVAVVRWWRGLAT